MNNRLWLHRYRMCLRFASFYSSEFRYDIVHDAYLYYLNKTKDDLFEIELKNESSYLYTVVKKAFYRWSYKERTGDNYQYLSTDWLCSKFDSPDDVLIGKDLYEAFYKKLMVNINPIGVTPTAQFKKKNAYILMDIFRLRASGYTQKEIATELEVSKQLVNGYIKKIDDMTWLNPFNGSRLVVKKVITEAQWDKRIDKEDYIQEDLNEYYVLWEHKESKEGLLVKLKEMKTNPYLK